METTNPKGASLRLLYSVRAQFKMGSEIGLAKAETLLQAWWPEVYERYLDTYKALTIRRQSRYDRCHLSHKNLGTSRCSNCSWSQTGRTKDEGSKLRCMGMAVDEASGSNWRTLFFGDTQHLLVRAGLCEEGEEKIRWAYPRRKNEKGHWVPLDLE